MPDWLWIGGFIGEVRGGVVVVTNCVNSGAVIYTPSDVVGNIIGRVTEGLDSVTVNHCFWTNNTNCSEACKLILTTTSQPETSMMSLDQTDLSKLNIFSEQNSWNRWVLNTNKNQVTFKINNCMGFSYSSELILLPDPIEVNGGVFRGWFTDPKYTENFTATEVTEPMTD